MESSTVGDRSVATKRNGTNALLLTGAPGMGKTTVVQHAIRQLPAATIRGFYTEEIRTSGVRRGFRLISFDGRATTLAHTDFSSRFRVGKYGVDVAMLDEWSPALLDPTSHAQLYVVDEIGKMECLSPRFVAAMRTLLDAGRPLIATIALRGSGFIAEVKRRPGTQLWEVTRANRASLASTVAQWAGQALNKGASS